MKDVINIDKYLITEKYSQIILALLLLVAIPITLPGKILSFDFQPYLAFAMYIFVLSNIFSVCKVRHERFNLKTFRFHLSHDPLTFPFLLILVCLPLSIWSSYARDLSWIITNHLLFGCALYWNLLNLSFVKIHPQLLAFSLIFCSNILSVVLLPVVAWKPEFRLFQLPLYSIITSVPVKINETIHANVFAGFLVLLLPLLFALCFQRHRRFLFLFGFLLIASVLVLTQSRGAYLAVMIALPLVGVFFFPYFRFSILVGLLVIAILFARGLVTYNFLDQLSTDGSLGGWDGRLNIWYNSALAISDFALTGIGIGTFTLVLPLLYPLNVNINEYPHAHNLFLQIGLDLGLPGLIAYIALLINLFVMLISTLRNPHTLPLHRTLAIGATGSLVGMLVHGLLDAVTWGTKLAFVPWILFALITQLFLYTQATQAAHKAASALQNQADADK